MISLFLVLVFTFSVRRKIVAMADDVTSSPARARLAALFSLSLWTTIAVGGRWIGFP